MTLEPPSLFDLGRLDAHRRQQALDGLPLLTPCPNTAVVKLLKYFGTLDMAGQKQLLDEMAAEEAEGASSTAALQQKEKRARRYPALAAMDVARTAALNDRGAATLPVKIVAGAIKDPAAGSLDAWARLLGLPDAATILRPPLARKEDDLVPVAPRRLRKLVETMAVSRFGATPERIDADRTWFVAEDNGWKMALDIHWCSNRGWRRDHQFDYWIWLRPPDGQRIRIPGYESLWREQCTWNYLTEENAERSVDHLGVLVETTIGLVRR